MSNDFRCQSKSDAQYSGSSHCLSAFQLAFNHSSEEATHDSRGAHIYIGLLRVASDVSAHILEYVLVLGRQNLRWSADLLILRASLSPLVFLASTKNQPTGPSGSLANQSHVVRGVFVRRSEFQQVLLYMA